MRKRFTRRRIPQTFAEDFWLNTVLVPEHFTLDDPPRRGRFKPNSLDERRWDWLRRQLRRGVHPRDRRVLDLYYLDELTCAECARRLKVHPATVRRRLERTLWKLRREARLYPELWPLKPGRWRGDNAWSG